MIWFFGLFLLHKLAQETLPPLAHGERGQGTGWQGWLAGLNWVPGLGWAGLAGLGWAGLAGCAGLGGWARLGWAGWARLGWAGWAGWWLVWGLVAGGWWVVAGYGWWPCGAVDRF